MSLRFSQPTSRGLYSLAFNQDASCIVMSTHKGISIWSLENDKRCIELYSVGATSISTMLYCTSLLAFAGAGEQPTSSPRKLTIFNTTNQTAISNISFPSSVLSILLNRKQYDISILMMIPIPNSVLISTTTHFNLQSLCYSGIQSPLVHTTKSATPFHDSIPAKPQRHRSTHPGSN